MSRRRRIAAPAPRALPRKRPQNARHDRFEVRARAQTELLIDPTLRPRELALKLGVPFIVLRDALMGDGPQGTGLSQYRWPDMPEDEAATA
jgi:hypothetical protein